MLNLLSQIPSKSHSRSATLPNAFDPAARPIHERTQSHPGESHVKGLPLEIPSTIPELPSPAPPIRAHHHSYTGNVNSTSELPPLITRPQRLQKTVGSYKSDSSTPFELFSQSPGSSRGASPTRNCINIDHTNTVRKTNSTSFRASSQSPISSRHGSRTRNSVNINNANAEAVINSGSLAGSCVKSDHTNAGESINPRKLASWFQGESHPIKVSLIPSPTKEDANPLESITITTPTRPTGALHRKSTSQVLPAMASRFSFFNSKASLSKPMSSKGDDELAEYDIHTALFPAGAPDPSAPTAFKDLQRQAEGLLTRLQVAYKERATALKDTLAENDALSEETQGAETRAQHLKLQLDAMAVQLAEQDKAMMAMVDELAQEKLARREEEEARKRSVRLVDILPTTKRSSRPRRSTISDSGFESEDESSAESVFSRQDGTYSPTMSMSSVSTDNSPDVYQAREVTYSPTHAARLRIPPTSTKPAQQPCTNCHGVRSSDAWPTVGVLKEENQGLKQRIGELEGALDGCLQLVGKLG